MSGSHQRSFKLRSKAILSEVIFLEAQEHGFEWGFLVLKIEGVVGHLGDAPLPLIPSKKRSKP